MIREDNNPLCNVPNVSDEHSNNCGEQTEWAPGPSTSQTTMPKTEWYLKLEPAKNQDTTYWKLYLQRVPT